jgi:hypothetical protein
VSLRAFVLYLCCIVLLGGCTVVVGGTALESPELAKQRALAKQPLLVKEAFGDFATADYCGVYREEFLHLPEDLADSVVKPTSQIAYCEVKVLKDGWRAFAAVGWLSRLRRPDGNGQRLTRQLRLFPGEGDPRLGCERYIKFPDGYSLRLVLSEDKPGKLPEAERERLRCAVADGLAEIIAESLAAGPIARLRGLSAHTLVRDDVCDLVPQRTLRKAGLPVGQQLRSADGHECVWYDDEGAPVGLAFIEVTDVHPIDAGQATIAGRSTVVEPWEGYAVGPCSASTQSAVFPDGGWEEVVLVVYDNPSDPDPCPSVERLARLVWPTLPKQE